MFYVYGAAVSVVALEALLRPPLLCAAARLRSPLRGGAATKLRFGPLGSGGSLGPHLRVFVPARRSNELIVTSSARPSDFLDSAWAWEAFVRDAVEGAGIVGRFGVYLVAKTEGGWPVQNESHVDR